MDQISRLTGPVAFFKNFVEIAFLFLAICAIVAAFCIITIQVVVALLTFKFGSLAAFVLVPFAVLSKTAFIAERPLGWVDRDVLMLQKINPDRERFPDRTVHRREIARVALCVGVLIRKK
jgi:hypothetical protein